MDKFAYVSIVLAFLTGVGLSGIYFSDLEPEVTINRTEGDTKTVHNIEPPRYNYIQANNHDVEYEGTTGSIEVKNISRFIEVNGLSMRPTFFTGHTLLAREFKNQSLEEGTIISADGVTHRVVGDYIDTSGYYLTRGDNNNRGSETVKPEEIDSVIVGVLYTEH